LAAKTTNIMHLAEKSNKLTAERRAPDEPGNFVEHE